MLHALKWLSVIIVGLLLFALGFSSSSTLAERLSALLYASLIALSTAYLLFVAPKVHLAFSGIDDVPKEPSTENSDEEARGIVHKMRHLLSRAPKHKATPSEIPTIQVRRLGTTASLGSVVNDAPLPVLRAKASFVLTPEDGDKALRESPSPNPFHVTEFSVPAHGSLPAAQLSSFDHVGIFLLQSEGVRIYDLIGLFSRTRGPAGLWRVRVVPNVYRLTQGIPLERRVSQTSEGIPDTPSDALDYDRVREYRPGDPLKTIHWKIVAHSNGELYTKLFETSTLSSATLLIDPYGPDANAETLGTTFRLHDTMLEGGFSLIEHARENGMSTRLCFLNRTNQLVETNWNGTGSLGWFVETAQRPTSSQEALRQSVIALQTLQGQPSGYVIYATSRLSEFSVRELIACHHGGTALLVVHALPVHSQSDKQHQMRLDARLRQASIHVVDLTHGSQIIQEVVAS